MPVMECQCGMVMSVSAAGSPVRCLRCGGSQLARLGQSTAECHTRVDLHDVIARTASFRAPPRWARPGATVAEWMRDGSHI